MATYQDELLGAPLSLNSGKDYILQFPETGVIDIYQETLVGGVDYVVSALGASNGGSLPDPAVVIFDGSGQLVSYQQGSFVLGGLDPFFTFRPPGLGIGQTGTFYVGVFDQTGSTGSYTLAVEGAGPPVFFGGLSFP
ncbi:hypothetical protein [Leptothoe kymatousa]|uniref:Uncharacterized protein n=1 Tax=Leptothoe kymatousa TAU-MAC 1615 TaxID=2364775 RepID=A0ABS5Y3W3_9CYAN|nr:hypothetical protein [Leptothoe kymatousa]MBT9312534.1 hypothetical protein [Leptothoe kymatousa TAU-MAC 1615]